MPIRDIIAGLNTAQVSYIVVGGVAVVLHGRSRLTMDLDLVIQLDDGNIRKTLDVLTRFGLKPRLPVQAADFADAATRKRWVEERRMTVFSMASPTDPSMTVDLFASYPMDYASMLNRSILSQLGDTPVRICAIDDLIAMKKSAGRMIDRVDIEELEIIRRGRSQET